MSFKTYSAGSPIWVEGGFVCLRVASIKKEMGSDGGGTWGNKQSHVRKKDRTNKKAKKKIMRLQSEYPA